MFDSLTWFGFGFATRLPFDLWSSFHGLWSRLFALFAAFADSPPGAAAHQQRGGRLSAWSEAENQQALTVHTYCMLSIYMLVTIRAARCFSKYLNKDKQLDKVCCCLLPAELLKSSKHVYAIYNTINYIVHSLRKQQHKACLKHLAC